MDNKNVKIPSDKLADFCRRNHICKLSLFGSVLRADFSPDSDVDLLVEFIPEAQLTLFDLVRIQEELKELFGREVDLVSRRGVESSRNYIRRQQILDSAEVLYAAG
jgi:predicted nucleotidyltransferase